MRVKALVVLQIEVSPRVKFNSDSVGGLSGRSGQVAEEKERWTGIKSEIEHRT